MTVHSTTPAVVTPLMDAHAAKARRSLWELAMMAGGEVRYLEVEQHGTFVHLHRSLTPLLEEVADLSGLPSFDVGDLWDEWMTTDEEVHLLDLAKFVDDQWTPRPATT